MESSMNELGQEMLSLMHRLRRMRPSASKLPDGITPAEMHVLLGLHMCEKRHEGPARPGIMADRLHVTKGALSQTLKGLEEKGFINRSRLEGDSRAVGISLTGAGHEVIALMNQRRDTEAAELLNYIGREDLEHCISTMNKVIAFQENHGFEEVAFVPGRCPHETH